MTRRILSLTALLLGLSMLGYAAHIPVKAWLAQQLLERAWETSIAEGEAKRPWSWADTRPIARLSQKRLGISQIVLEGASGRVLAFGPGQVSGTAQPGTKGNLVLSGHRDTHFSWLRDLRPGDLILLESLSGQRRYRVRTTTVRHESETGLLHPDLGDRLSLVTCFPFDAVAPGTRFRYVVTTYPVPS